MGENKRLQTFMIVGLLFLFLICGVYSYFGILSPLHQEITSIDTQIQQQKTFLNKSESVPAVQNTNENTFLLQEEVPVKPLMDQLMLQFEKAEVLSDSLILTMQFSDGEAKEDEEVADGEEAVNSEPITETNSPADDVKTETNATDSKVNVTTESLPEGVKKITAEMSVISKNYDGLLKFLQTIEDMKRVIVIEGLTFTGLDEIEMAAAESSPDQLKYEVTIAAYYLPELTDYLKDLPRGEFPAPNGKENPLSGAELKTDE